MTTSSSVAPFSTASQPGFTADVAQRPICTDGLLTEEFSCLTHKQDIHKLPQTEIGLPHRTTAAPALAWLLESAGHDR